MRNTAPASARLPAGSPPATPDPARTAWPRMAAVGLLLIVLGLLALGWHGSGDRVLLAGLGVVGVVRGAGMLRGVRAGGLHRVTAVSGALAVWLGLVTVAVALLSGAAASWVLVAGVVLGLPALAPAGGRRAPRWAATAAVLVAVVLLAVLAGTDALLGVGTAVAALLVALLGVANLLGAVGMRRIARRPAPAAAAGCAGCACGAGGCGSPG